MITHEHWSLIHTLRKQEGWGVRPIAQYVQLARNTVRSALKRAQFEPATRRVRRDTVLTPFQSQLSNLAGQARYNARRVYENLRGQGYAGGYQQVARKVRPLREQARAKVRGAPLASPREVGHVYWGTTLVWMGKTRVRVHLFLMMLGYRGGFTGTFALDEKMSTFLKCHEAAFHTLKWVPKHMVYDNPNKVMLPFDAQGQRGEWHPWLIEFLEELGVQSLRGSSHSLQTRGRIKVLLKSLKENFLCGRRFENMKVLNAKFEQWMDQRMTGQIRSVEPLRPSSHVPQEPQNFLPWDEQKFA